MEELFVSNDDKTLGRRSFLASSAAGIAAGGLMTPLGKRALNLQDIAPEKPVPKAASPIITRTLGRTGLKIPVVSMGVMNASLPDLVRRSFELGVRHFDTAAVYQRGRNEEMVGKVIKDLKVRDQAIIATKVFLMPPERKLPAEQIKELYLRSVEESLKRLQTDYVDILYIHNVTTVDEVHNAGAREALKILQKQGKTRFIGFSTHQNMAELIADAAKEDFWDVILTTYNFALSDDEKLNAALRAAAAKNIGLVAMKTQASQEWYVRELPENLQKLSQGTLVHPAMLKWVLQHPFITTAIPGYTTFQHMEENFSVARNLEFSAEEKKFLTLRNIKLAMGHCRQCTECVAQCPNHADVPALMRVHMYAASYRNFEHARMTLEEIEEGRSLANCTSCGSCRVKCRNGVNVAARISELARIYA
jgi:uncharacterized protein